MKALRRTRSATAGASRATAESAVAPTDVRGASKPPVLPMMVRTRSKTAAAAPALTVPVTSAESLPMAFAVPSPSRPDVGMFWDYECLGLPHDGAAANAAAARLAGIARGYGTLAEARVYHDSGKNTGAIGARHRSVLSDAGFTLIDCPTHDKKEAVDKKIIVDALLFACRPRPNAGGRVVVILVTNDGDFSYCLNRLRQQGVHAIAVSSRRSSPALRHACNAVLSWEQTVLRGSVAEVAGDDKPNSKRRRKAAEPAPPTSTARPRRRAGENGPSSRQSSMPGVDMALEDVIKMRRVR